MKCNDRASNYFTLNWCQINMAEIESRANGTTFAEISKQNFRPILVVLPPRIDDRIHRTSRAALR